MYSLNSFLSSRNGPQVSDVVYLMHPQWAGPDVLTHAATFPVRLLVGELPGGVLVEAERISEDSLPGEPPWSRALVFWVGSLLRVLLLWLALLPLPDHEVLLSSLLVFFALWWGVSGRYDKFVLNDFIIFYFQLCSCSSVCCVRTLFLFGSGWAVVKVGLWLDLSARACQGACCLCFVWRHSVTECCPAGRRPASCRRWPRGRPV